MSVYLNGNLGSPSFSHSSIFLSENWNFVRKCQWNVSSLSRDVTTSHLPLFPVVILPAACFHRSECLTVCPIPLSFPFWYLLFFMTLPSIHLSFKFSYPLIFEDRTFHLLITQFLSILFHLSYCVLMSIHGTESRARSPFHGALGNFGVQGPQHPPT